MSPEFFLQTVLISSLLILCALVVRVPLAAQTGQSQIVAIRAGRVFDPKAGTNLANQVVLVFGNRIAVVEPAARARL